MGFISLVVLGSLLVHGTHGQWEWDGANLSADVSCASSCFSSAFSSFTTLCSSTPLPSPTIWSAIPTCISLACTQNSLPFPASFDNPFAAQTDVCSVVFDYDWESNYWLGGSAVNTLTSTGTGTGTGGLETGTRGNGKGSSGGGIVATGTGGGSAEVLVTSVVGGALVTETRKASGAGAKGFGVGGKMLLFELGFGGMGVLLAALIGTMIFL